MIPNIHKDLNVDYFKDIDTNEKAYWLGFLFADAYVTKTNGSMRLKLSIKDEETLDKFILAVGADSSLKKQFGPYKTCGVSIEVTISDRQFVSHLIKLGCVNKKSLIIRFPELSSRELDLAFMMGFFDGDGNESNTTFSCGSKDFVTDVCDKFEIDMNSTKVKHVKENLWIVTLGAKLFKEMLDIYHGSMQRKRRTHEDQNSIFGSPYSEENMMRKIPIRKPSGKIPKRKPPVYIDGVKVDGRKILGKVKKRKFEITKEELHKLVWSMPTTKVAAMFNVSDKAIERRCKLLGVTKPPLGYWAKVSFGKITPPVFE